MSSISCENRAKRQIALVRRKNFFEAVIDFLCLDQLRDFGLYFERQRADVVVGGEETVFRWDNEFSPLLVILCLSKHLRLDYIASPPGKGSEDLFLRTIPKNAEKRVMIEA